MAVKNLMNKSFLTRAISGVFLVIIIAAAGLLGGDVLFGLVGVVSLIGLYEIYKVIKIEKSMLGVVGYLATIAYYALIRFYGTEFTVPVIIGFLLMVLAVYVLTFPKFKTDQVTLTVFGFVYVVILMSFLYLVRMTEDGIYTFWLVFVGSWICDTCAYLAGVVCGKHKMAPILSPKKTIEGAIGGVVGAAGVGALYGYLVGGQLEAVKYPVIMFAIICGIAGLVSMIGDLSASAIKRNYDVKDYGKLIPGHGGVLDRFDSVIATAPIIYFLFVVLA